MFNWSRHLLADPGPALGWKKLDEPSKNALKFLEDGPDLETSQQAKALGVPGLYVPNFADAAAITSLYGSFFFLEELLQLANDTLGPVNEHQVGAAAPEPIAVLKSGQESGSTLEKKIALGLRAQLAELEMGLGIVISSKGSPDIGRSSFKLTDYWPYSPPPTSGDPPGAAEFYRQMGRGHLIQPDVVVWREISKRFLSVQDGVVREETYPVHHLIACISGKATIRSDRSQSSRYEGSTISRWRHGRPPHFVVVTAEPDPARLGSLAWGLGEIDCVYHVGLPALRTAIQRVDDRFGKQKQKLLELDQLIEQARVRDLSMLFDDLFGEFAG